MHYPGAVYALCGDVEVPGYHDTPSDHHDLSSTSLVLASKSGSIIAYGCCMTIRRR
jgi:hypothetical protein